METLKSLRFAMQPKRPMRSRADDLFRNRLANIIDPRHELVRLGELIDWRGFEAAFGRFYKTVGRPGLRQSYVRLAKQARHRVQRYGHAKQYRRMGREVRRLKTYLGRVYRDVGRKIAGNPTLLDQTRTSSSKLYSLHAPEVGCFNRGKASGRYEFGAKVGIAATNREGFVLAAKAFARTPYDGHTLQGTLDQAARMTGIEPAWIYVDRGYRGHDYQGEGRVVIAGQKRGLTPTMRREQRRRNGLEATIGHAKFDHRMDQNYLLGHLGDAINALAAACGYNLRRILDALRRLCAQILFALTIDMAKLMTWPSPRYAITSAA